MKIAIFPFTTAMCGVCGGHMQTATDVRAGVADPHILMECLTENCPQQKQRVKIRAVEIAQEPVKRKKR